MTMSSAPGSSMSDERKIRIGMALISLVVGVAGFCIFWSFDWRIAVGAFLLEWAHNINNRLEKMREKR